MLLLSIKFRGKQARVQSLSDTSLPRSPAEAASQNGCLVLATIQTNLRISESPQKSWFAKLVASNLRKPEATIAAKDASTKYWLKDLDPYIHGGGGGSIFTVCTWRSVINHTHQVVKDMWVLAPRPGAAFNQWFSETDAAWCCSTRSSDGNDDL